MSADFPFDFLQGAGPEQGGDDQPVLEGEEQEQGEVAQQYVGMEGLGSDAGYVAKAEAGEEEAEEQGMESQPGPADPDADPEAAVQEEQYILDPTCDPNADFLRYINPTTLESILIRHTDLKQCDGNIAVGADGIAQPFATSEAEPIAETMETMPQEATENTGLTDDQHAADMQQNLEYPVKAEKPAEAAEEKGEEVAADAEPEFQAAGEEALPEGEEPAMETEQGQGDTMMEAALPSKTEEAEELAAEPGAEEGDAGVAEAEPEAGQEVAQVSEAGVPEAGGQYYQQLIYNEDGTQSIVYYQSAEGVEGVEGAEAAEQQGEVKYAFEQGAGDATQQMLVSGEGTGGMQTSLVAQDGLQAVLDAGGSVIQQVLAEGENGSQVMYYLVTDPTGEAGNAVAYVSEGDTGTTGEAVTFDSQAGEQGIKSEVKQEWQQAGTEQTDPAYQAAPGQQITTLYYDEQGNLVSSSTGEDPNSQGLLENYYAAGQISGEGSGATMLDADGNLVQVVYTLPDGTPIDESQLAGQNYVLTNESGQVLTTDQSQNKFGKNLEMTEKISLGNGVTVTTVKPPLSGQNKARGRGSDGRSMIQYSTQDESGRKVVVLNPNGASGSSGLRGALQGTDATFTTSQTPSGKTMVIMGSGDKWTTTSSSSSRSMYSPIARRGRQSKFESGASLAGKPNVKVITLKSLQQQQQQQQGRGMVTSTPITSRSQLNFKTFMNDSSQPGMETTDGSFIDYSYTSPVVSTRPVTQMVQVDENPEESGVGTGPVPVCPPKEGEEEAPPQKPMPSFFERIRQGMKRDVQARVAKRQLHGDDQIQSISLYDDESEPRRFYRKTLPQIKRIKKDGTVSTGRGRGRGVVMRGMEMKPGTRPKDIREANYRIGTQLKAQGANESADLSQTTDISTDLPTDTSMDTTFDSTLPSSQESVGVTPVSMRTAGRGRGRGRGGSYMGRGTAIKTKTNIITITVPLKSSKGVGPILSATTKQAKADAERESEIRRKAAAAVQKALAAPREKMSSSPGKTPVYIRSGLKPGSAGTSAAGKAGPSGVKTGGNVPGFKVIRPAAPGEVTKAAVKVTAEEKAERDGGEKGEKEGEDNLTLECESFTEAHHDNGDDDEEEERIVNPNKIEEAIAALIKATPRVGGKKTGGVSSTTGSIGRAAATAKSSKDVEEEEEEEGEEEEEEDPTPVGEPLKNQAMEVVKKDKATLSKELAEKLKTLTAKQANTVPAKTKASPAAATKATPAAAKAKVSPGRAAKTEDKSGSRSDSGQDSQSDKETAAPSKGKSKVLLVPSKAHAADSKPAAKAESDKKKNDDEEEDLPCSSCENQESESPNEIVLCDGCGKGYHQFCHDPEVTSAVLELPEWLCKECLDKKDTVKQTSPERDLFVPDSPVFDTKLFAWFPESLVLRGSTCKCQVAPELKQGMLQCYTCRSWFHPECTAVMPHPVMVGDYFYVYVCETCNFGNEYLRRLKPRWLDLCHLAMFHMSVLTNHKYFDISEEIVQWMKTNKKHLDLPNKMLNEMDSVKFVDKITFLLTSPAYVPRFKNGREVKRKVSLVGLRTRAPPTPPTCRLPKHEKLTNENTRNWSWRITYQPFHPPSVDIATFLKSSQDGSTMKRSPERKSSKATPKPTPASSKKAGSKRKAEEEESEKEEEEEESSEGAEEDAEQRALANISAAAQSRGRKRAAEATPATATPGTRGSKRRKGEEEEEEEEMDADEEERPRQCPYCNKEFMSLKKLKQHEWSAHKKGINPLKCVCGDVFRTPYELSAHKRKECTKTI